MQWLAISLLLSVVLTVVLNVGLRLVPRTSERATTDVGDEARPRTTLRVFVPWRAMLLGSLLLTFALNLALWFR